MSLRTWAAPLPFAKLILPGIRSVTCLAFAMPVSSFKWAAFAVAVTLVSSTVIVYWSVTSLPTVLMPLTLDWSSRSASASYTRISDFASASNR